MIPEQHCFMCGAVEGEPHHFELGTLTALLQREPEDGFASAICSVCNEGASNITPDRSSLIKLKTQVRKARAADQIALLSWLKGKFPDNGG